MTGGPNVIYIYADDLGRGMLSCYPKESVPGEPTPRHYFQTPNIDRLAAQGVRFTRAYGCAFCAPARASLLCGVHDAHAGRWTFTRAGIYREVDTGAMTVDEIFELIHNTGMQAGPDDVFLPQIFKQAGYATGQIGKLEWGFATTGDRIKQHGWDYHYGWYDHQRCHGFYPTFLFENGEKRDIPGNDFINCGVRHSAFEDGKPIDMTGRAVYSQDLFDEKILEFMRSHKDEPFFLFHPSQLPHGAVFYPDLYPSVADHPDLTTFEKEFASMVLRLDTTVGLILDELDRLGLADNTIFLFSSDNGHALQNTQHGKTDRVVSRDGVRSDNVRTKFYSDTHGDIFDGNDGMAGLKTENWEGGPIIPYIIRWPGHVESGTVSDHMIANYDLMPTFAELLGVDMPEGKDGVSFASLIDGSGREPRKHEDVVYASYMGPSLVAEDGWKIRTYLDKGPLPWVVFGNDPRELESSGAVVFQLYNLRDDPREEHDVADQYPEKLAELRRRLFRACDGNLLNATPQAHFAYYGLDWTQPRVSQETKARRSLSSEQ